ncbi:DUF1028 domain-containing protein [Pseudonocardia sp. ICBG1142]|uniref:DUF1028 domain-containing protein n=1 Tax=Pseudonocardia sp. ICBG1142 TaxID=2846760 RepID=UPI001CF6B572|nr:DUF1028 domain-containing protein [Pseudonocardia sp. ICBG1142]
MTYSIVARDPATGQLGVGCESHFFAPGAGVTRADPGVGAIATQAFVDGRYAGAGMAALAEGRPAAEVLDELVAADPHPQVRQVALVGRSGDAASRTGGSCIGFCGGIVEGPVAVQGNMLASDRVLPEMLAAYRSAPGDLAERLMVAMEAAEAAGGDVRGSQGASLVVVDGEPVSDPWNHRPVDLRVDDHPDPVGELRRLLGQRRAFDAVSSTMFAPGLMVGPYHEPSPGDRDRALARLAAAARVMVGNPEADFWAAVLLARSGDRAAARERLAGPLRQNPRLRGFLGRMAEAGFLDHGEIEELL